MLKTFLRRLWYLVTTLKPLNHTSGAIPVIAGIAYSWHQKDLATSTLLLYFIIFLIFYSALYQMNEFFDYESDSKDEIRKKRPLASGKISKSEVAASAIFLGLTSFSALVCYKPELVLSLTTMLLINLLYVTVLKRFRYLDFSIISLTFVAKFIFGVLLCSSQPLTLSVWLIGGFFYSSVAALHCTKKEGRILNSSLRTYLKIPVLRLMKYSFLIFGFISLLFSQSEIHFALWCYFTIFLLVHLALDFIPATRTAFFTYQRWYSSI